MVYDNGWCYWSGGVFRHSEYQSFSFMTILVDSLHYQQEHTGTSILNE